MWDKLPIIDIEVAYQWDKERTFYTLFNHLGYLGYTHL